MGKKPLKAAAAIIAVLIISIGIIYVLFNVVPQSKPMYDQSSEENSIASVDASGDESLDYVESSGVESTEPKELKADLSVIKDYEDKYFVKKLSEENKYYFCELYRAASEHKESVEFDIPVNEDELSVLMHILNYDCPELIHLNGEYFSNKTGDKAEYVNKVTFSYCMTEERYADALNELDIFFEKLVSDLDGKSEYEKEKYVYDYIFTTCNYDELTDISGSAYGALLEGSGRCEAYCKAFMWCMRRLGIECLCVSGARNWDSDSMFSEHSWNIVKIDGDWYHVDITVDNVRHGSEADNPPNYGFFNADDSYINESHEISDFYLKLGIPKCSSFKLNYHKMNNLFVTSGNAEEKLKSIMLEHFDESGIDNLSVRFESSDDYNRILGNMEGFITEFLIDNSEDIFEYNTHYNKLSKTIIINLKKKDTSEGE